MQCSCLNVTVDEYDFGTCSETGYHDAGVRVVCDQCGETFTDSEYRRYLDAVLVYEEPDGPECPDCGLHPAACECPVASVAKNGRRAA